MILHRPKPHPLSIAAFVIFFFQLQTLCAQVLHPLEPMDAKYETITHLSRDPNPARAALDTIHFPWSEYGKGALSNALWRTVYLLPADEARLSALVTFPANSSDETRAELDYLLLLQQNRTAQEIKRAEHIAEIGSWPDVLNPADSDYAENRQELFYIFTTATGRTIRYEHYPATTALLMNCIQDIRVTEFRLKKYFKRPRPYHLEPKLQPLARIHSPSFPSGHSLWSYTEAYIFGELIPGIRQKCIGVANEVRWSRELMGIHYPSDNEASRRLGWYLVKFWYKNPRFIADLQLARKEWDKQR